MNHNILLVGCGGVGSRHLEAIASLKKKIHIFVIEKNQDAILSAKKILNASKKSVHSPKFVDWVEVPREIFLCIIAVDANNRLKILERTQKNYKVKNIILEKILFNKIHEFEVASDLLKIQKTSAWVNCPLRFNQIFQKDFFKKEVNYNLKVFGSNWKIASNAMHFIDLWCYLNGTTNYSLINSNVSKKLIQSKRKGYKEFFGFLTFKNVQGAVIHLNCFESDILWYQYNINTDNINIDFNPLNNYAALDSNGASKRMFSFHEEPQSTLSNQYLKLLLNDEALNLTDYHSSAEIHKTYLKSIIPLFKFANTAEMIKIT